MTISDVLGNMRRWLGLIQVTISLTFYGQDSITPCPALAPELRCQVDVVVKLTHSAAERKILRWFELGAS
eukprot:s1203_g14.t1